MSTTVKAKGDFAQVDAGTHTAYCYAVIDIGHQESMYQGKRNVKPQVILCFEFPSERVNIDGEDKPMIMSTFYTASLSTKANLRGDLEAWRGRAFTPQELDGFELKNVIGKPVTVSVFHNESGKARIKGLSAAMKGVQLPAMYNKPLWFDLDVHGVNSPEYRAVPEWIQEFIQKRVDADSENPAPAGVEAQFDDEAIPF